jgi:hypothetical protein
VAPPAGFATDRVGRATRRSVGRPIRDGGGETFLGQRAYLAWIEPVARARETAEAICASEM